MSEVSTATPMRVDPQDGNWWKTFVSVAFTVAKIAVQVLPILLAAAEEDADPDDPQTVTETGPVKWTVSTSSGEAFAQNTDPAKRVVQLTIAQNDQDVHKLFVYTLRPDAAAMSVTEAFKELPDGEVTISFDSGTAPSSPGNGYKLVRFSLPFALTGVSIYLGAKLSVKWNVVNPRQGNFEIGFDPNVRPKNGEISATTPGGFEVKAKTEFRKPDGVVIGDTELVALALPPGLNDLDDRINNVEIKLEVPTAVFEQISSG